MIVAFLMFCPLKLCQKNFLAYYSLIFATISFSILWDLSQFKLVWILFAYRLIFFCEPFYQLPIEAHIDSVSCIDTFLIKPREKKKTQKTSNQCSVKNDEEEPNCEKVKPQRVGSTPAYGFAFKCDERAEKRREVNLLLDNICTEFSLIHMDIIPFLTHSAIK